MVMFSKPALVEMNYSNIPRKNVEWIVCVDTAFAVNKDKSSQLGILVMLPDPQNVKANLVQYSLCKSKHVSKPVLASELFATVDVLVVGFVVVESL